MHKKKRAASFSDAYEFKATQLQSIDKVYMGVFGTLPNWVTFLMKLRNIVVKPFGLTTGSTIQMAPKTGQLCQGAKAGFLTIEHLDKHEIVANASDNDMGMYISVMHLEQQTYRISTLVNLKSCRAKIYVACVKPFHRRVVPQSIISALKANRI